jgi:hypothetical protein
VKRVLVTIATAGPNDEHCDEGCPLLHVELQSDNGDTITGADHYCRLGDEDGVLAWLKFDRVEYRPKRSEHCKREAK